MLKAFTMLLMLLLAASVCVAQVSVIAEVNGYEVKNNWTGPDSLRPWATDQGVRCAWVTNDLDKDGKPEVLATDYSNKGRIHVLEMTASNTLEIVWSSPRYTGVAALGATPATRWVRAGDLDGDGMGEIVFTDGRSTTGDLQVYEWTGADNDYGTEPALTLPYNLYSSLGTGAFLMHRETGALYDFDGDHRDELITANGDRQAYVLGVNGDIPGFGAWQIEGGDPTVVKENMSGGSWWASVPADIDGDGVKEIVNHHYDSYGFWSIDPIGPNQYHYPQPVAEGRTNAYHKYLSDDGVAYMGVQVVDVDGDGKQEIAGILYPGTAPYNNAVSLVSVARGDTGVYVWRDSTQFGIIGKQLWTLAGKTSGEHWAIGGYDFDGNGRDEIYVGGFADYNVISLQYKGSGNILDENSYDKTIVYPGASAFYHEFEYWDSLGVKTDTVRKESPFCTKMFAGSDINGNGKAEIVLTYQSIADSIKHTHYMWDTTGLSPVWKIDSTWKVKNTNVISIRVLEYGTTGFKELPIKVVTPEDYVLGQNYPNPFNPSTTIRFSLPVDKRISLIVYDLLGREVKRLIDNQDFKQGPSETVWDGTNDLNQPAASGTYVYTLKYGNFSKSEKMVLLR
jgi:hypothetical protein